MASSVKVPRHQCSYRPKSLSLSSSAAWPMRSPTSGSGGGCPVTARARPSDPPRAAPMPYAAQEGKRAVVKKQAAPCLHAKAGGLRSTRREHGRCRACVRMAARCMQQQSHHEVVGHPEVASVLGIGHIMEQGRPCQQQRQMAGAVMTPKGCTHPGRCPASWRPQTAPAARPTARWRPLRPRHFDACGTGWPAWSATGERAWLGGWAETAQWAG